MFGKKSKQVKTQYETENQQLGRQAYPYIQPAMDRMNDLSMNPDKYRQEYINKYFGKDTPEWNDAMRNYQRIMGNTTANNYNATHGGYSSAGQKLYSDTQRAQNDLISRLNSAGVTGSQNLLNNDLNNVAGLYKNLNYQHGMAQQGDAIDEYNKLVDKSNKQWWMNALSEIGAAGEAIAPGPWKAIGTGLRVGGWLGSTDYSDAMARLGGQIGLSNDPASYANGAADLGGIVSSGIQNWSNWGGAGGWNNLFGGNSTGTNTNTSNNNTSSNSTGGIFQNPFTQFVNSGGATLQGYMNRKKKTP